MTPSIIWYECHAHILCGESSALVEAQYLTICLYHLYIIVSLLGMLCMQCTVLHNHLWALVDQRSHKIKVIVGPFGAIHNRSALNGNKSTVSLNHSVCTNCAGFHIEVYSHHIALLPFAIDGEVSVGLYFAFHLHSVHLNTILWAQVVAIFIQVTWHYLIAHPSRNTNLHPPLSSLVGSHLDCDVTIPGIFCSLLNSHFLTFHVKC